MRGFNPQDNPTNEVLADVYGSFQNIACGISIDDQSWLRSLCVVGAIQPTDPLHPHNRPELSLFARQKTNL